jgi:hypothetical protein
VAWIVGESDREALSQPSRRGESAPKRAKSRKR